MWMWLTDRRSAVHRKMIGRMYLNVTFFKVLIVVLGFCASSEAWDQSDFEIFDLVEEINRNFYEVLDVPQNCSQPEIRKAYRRLSLQLHPDKNDAPDAEEKFRQLVGIYEILRDEHKRAKYDQVLVEGLPNWRQPLYYYRRYRKMGNFELCTWVIFLFTIGQYAVAWASYFEKRLIEQSRNSKRKKQKKNQTDVNELQDHIENDEKPSFRNTLPFQVIPFVMSLPSQWRSLVEYIQLKRQEKREQELREKEEAEERERLREKKDRKKERDKEWKAQRKRILPDFSSEPNECILVAGDEPSTVTTTQTAPRPSGGLWTDEDLVELARLMKKYPVGTSERWEKIAEAMNRTVFEVTHFAKKIKDNAYRPLETNGVSEEAESETRIEKKKEKTRGGKALKDVEGTRDGTEGTVSQNPADGSTGWSQKQQKALESALAQFPKGSSERWDRIAKMVPDKTKEECMLRVKYLSEMVKKKKQMEQEEQLRGESKTETPDENQDAIN